MTKTIAVINQKGGVGKTASSTHASYCFSKVAPTLLIDLDPSRNATKVYDKNIVMCSSYTTKDVLEDKNFDPNDAIYETGFKNLFIMPSHISLAVLQSHLAGRTHKEKILKKQIQKINKIKPEFIIIDCPPLLSEFSIIATYAADFILIPTTYESDALDGIADLFDIISEVKEGQYYDYRILRNQYDKRTTTANEFIESELTPFKEKVLYTVIHQDSNINNAKMEKKIIFQYASNSISAHDYTNLSKELLEIFNAEKAQS